MHWSLLVVVAVPAFAALIGAALVALDRRRPLAVPVEVEAGLVERPSAALVRSVSLAAAWLTLAGAVVLLVEVARSGRLDLVASSTSDGLARVGLTAGRVEALLVLLTAAVGLVVQAYAARQLLGDPRASRFHLWAAALVATTNLTAVAASGWTFVVGWVGTSVAVVALVGHRRGWGPADRAVRRTARAFVIGDIALIAGIAIAITSAGHLDLRAAGDAVVAIDSEGAVTLIALLLVVAGIARSALVPLGGWLPTTLAAPTPVSALLHAGVVNGAGVLVLRFHPLVGDSAPALAVAYVAGVVTAVFATAVMLVRTDVKGGLVWSTAGQMGFMVAQLGAGALAAGLFHLLGHAMYKAAAFLGAGDAIGARARRQFRPARHGAAPAASLLVSLISLLVAAGAVAAALVVIDPHLNDVAKVLVATFATLAIARVLHGWLVTADLAGSVAVPVAIGGALAAAFAYVGGLAVVEGFVVDELPFELTDAVSVGWVVATVVLVAAGALAVSRLPGAAGDRLRAAVYARLVAAGAASSRTASLADATTARPQLPTPPVAAVSTTDSSLTDSSAPAERTAR